MYLIIFILFYFKMKKYFSFLTTQIKSSLYKKTLTTFCKTNTVTSFYKNNHYQFSTTNKVSQKESLELIEAGVFEVLKSAAKCKQDKLNRTATLEELGFDSLDQVELVVAMEEKFDLNISGIF
jgi:acyl carrier protein